MVKYIVKRLLLAVLILFGVSVIIYSLVRMMPTDYVDEQFSSALAQGTIQQEDVDRIKELYGLAMPDAYLTVRIEDGADSEYADRKFSRNTTEEAKYDVDLGLTTVGEWYVGSYDWRSYRLYLYDDGTYKIFSVESEGAGVTDDEDQNITVEETLTERESGVYTVTDAGSLSMTSAGGAAFAASVNYRTANFWDKMGAVLGGYGTWIFNLLQGDLGISFKYKKPVGAVITENMGVSFAIAFIATLLQFAIAIPLGIKAATKQYGVIDYTVTVFTMIGISLPTFFLAAIFIRVFAVQLGWFEVGGLVSGSLPVDAGWFVRAADVLWHMVLPMLVLVILGIGSLMRYTRTNTLEVLNADYIRTARAKGLSEHAVIYRHAFRNTMIPLVTMMAGILPSLFGGAMITETVFSIPGIGKLAYDALVVADVPFVMGYNMFLAIMTVLGTLLSDLMYAVVDPRVKLGR